MTETPFQAALRLQQELVDFDLEVRLARKSHHVYRETSGPGGTNVIDDETVKLVIKLGPESDDEAEVYVGSQGVYGGGDGWGNTFSNTPANMPLAIKNRLPNVFAEQARYKKALAQFMTKLLLGKSILKAWK